MEIALTAHVQVSGIVLLLNQLLQSVSLDAKLSSVPDREALRMKGTGKRRAVMPGVTKIKMTMYRTTMARGRYLPCWYK